jgi:hypothetical protein
MLIVTYVRKRVKPVLRKGIFNTPIINIQRPASVVSKNFLVLKNSISNKKPPNGLAHLPPI